VRATSPSSSACSTSEGRGWSTPLAGPQSSTGSGSTRRRATRAATRRRATRVAIRPVPPTHPALHRVPRTLHRVPQTRPALRRVPRTLRRVPRTHRRVPRTHRPVPRTHRRVPRTRPVLRRVPRSRPVLRPVPQDLLVLQDRLRLRCCQETQPRGEALKTATRTSPLRSSISATNASWPESLSPSSQNPRPETVPPSSLSPGRITRFFLGLGPT